jgi:hypothetical protein
VSIDDQLTSHYIRERLTLIAPDVRRSEVTTIASLAAEFDAQPYEVAAFGDLGDFPQDVELDADTENAIREAWGTASDFSWEAGRAYRITLQPPAPDSRSAGR